MRSHARATVLLAVQFTLSSFCAIQPSWAQSETLEAAALPPNARTPLSAIAGVALTTAPAGARIDTAPEAARERYETAVDLIEQGNYALAEFQLDAAIQLAGGEYYELFYELARVKDDNSGPASARPAAERAVALHPGAADPHFLLGDLCDRIGDAAVAIANFRTATLAASRELNNPNVTAAWHRLATLLEREGYLAAAEESYAQFDSAVWETHVEHRNAEPVAEILTRSPSGGVEARLSLLERLRRPDDAVRVAAAAARRQPESLELARRHIRALLAAGQADAALKLCRERLATSPANGEPAVANGGFLALTIEAARAANALDAWIDEVVAAVGAGRDLRVARELARLTGKTQPGGAVRLWSALHEHDPRDMDAAWSLALSLREAGDFERAFTTLAACIRADGTDAAAPGEALLIWMRSDPPPSSGLADAVTTAIARADRDFATDFVLATAAAAARLEPIARQRLAACIEAQRTFAPAEAALGMLCLASHEWDAARTHADAALLNAPAYALAHYVKAEAAAGLDDNESAAIAFKEAIRAAPHAALYRLALAKHFERTGEMTAAQRYYQEALGLDSTNGAALEGLIESYVDERKFDLAKQQLARAEQLSVSEDSLRRARTVVRYADAPYSTEHLAELQRQSELHPHDAETALKVVRALVSRGRIGDAAPFIERVERSLPDDQRTLMLLGWLHAEALDFGRAIESFESLHRRFPNREDVLQALGALYLNDFRIAESRAIVRRRIERAATEDDRDILRRALVRQCLELREYDDALRVLDEGARVGIDGERFRGERIRTLRLAGRPREALDSAVAWLEAEPDSFERRAEYLKSAIAAKEFDAALKRTQAWRAAAPQDIFLLSLTVRVLRAAGRADDAVATVEAFRPANIDPDDYQRRLLLAECRAAAGKLDAALAEIDALMADRAVQERGDYLPACQFRFIQLCNRYGATDLALERIDLWERSAGGAPGSSRDWLMRRRNVFAAANRNAECIAVMERLLDLYPAQREPETDFEDWLTVLSLYNDLGYMLVDRGEQLERATRMIRQALASDPRNAAYLDSLGWAYYKAGDFDAARKYISRAVRLGDGQDAVLYDHLGDAHFRAGDRNAAKQSWEESVRLIETDAERLAQFENEEDRPAAPVPPELLPAVRAKLAALDRGDGPNVAALAPGK